MKLDIDMRLYVNVDHVATVRQARMTDEPDPVRAALMTEQAGADGITVHLREDRRHIQDRDVDLLILCFCKCSRPPIFQPKRRDRATILPTAYSAH